jgi:hypothetical protein
MATALARRVAQRFVDHLNGVLNRTVSDSRLVVAPLASDPATFRLTRIVDDDDVALELDGTTARLFVQQIVVVEDDRCRTESYVYRLQADASPRSTLVRWEYRRDPPRAKYLSACARARQWDLPRRAADEPQAHCHLARVVGACVAQPDQRLGRETANQRLGSDPEAVRGGLRPPVPLTVNRGRPSRPTQLPIPTTIGLSERNGLAEPTSDGTTRLRPGPLTSSSVSSRVGKPVRDENTACGTADIIGIWPPRGAKGERSRTSREDALKL